MNQQLMRTIKSVKMNFIVRIQNFLAVSAVLYTHRDTSGIN